MNSSSEETTAGYLTKTYLGPQQNEYKTEHDEGYTMSTTTPSEAIREARERERLKRIEFDNEIARFRREHERKTLEKGIFLKDFGPANKGDYERWLVGHLEAGGKITHVYDYPWSRWDWFAPLKSGIEILPLYGSMSIQIIVPKGISIHGEWGHNDIFWMDGFRASSIVPIFSDINL